VNQGHGGRHHGAVWAPLAHEDHAVRACYAALATAGGHANAMREVRPHAGAAWWQMRVGLNSGEVVVRPLAMTCTWTTSAVAQTHHLAARMDSSPAGSILLTAADAAAGGGLGVGGARRWAPWPPSKAWRSRWSF